MEHLDNLLKFQQLEGKYNLFERDYHGYHYWQYIRDWLFIEIDNPQREITRIKVSKSNKEKRNMAEYARKMVSLAIKGEVYKNKHCGAYDVIEFSERISNDSVNRFTDYWEYPENYRVCEFTQISGELLEDDVDNNIVSMQLQAQIKFYLSKLLKILIEDKE